MFRSFAALVLAVLALAGCGAVEASTPKAAAVTPHLPCSLPYGTRVALLSPSPGSTGVTAGAAVLVAASRDLPKSVAVVATDAKGTASVAAPLERTAPPPAHAPRAPFPAAVYYRASGLTLHAHRHYTLSLDDVAQNGCAPYARIAGVARFST
jgi:hypothetical protein